MIVGIDPGTTVGWAILDFDGKFIAAGSKRNFDLDSIVATLVPYGKVFVVGTDKSKTPSLVQDVATKVGAKSISPSQDLRVIEKRAMTSNFKFENNHEMDALACAFFAFKQKKHKPGRPFHFMASGLRLDYHTIVLFKPA